jgi:sugar lactone lactonase YvrE
MHPFRLAVACVVVIGFLAALSQHANAEPVPRLYWADQWTGQILSANLDGTDIQSIVQRPIVHEPNYAGPHRLAMDEAQATLYWTDTAEDAVYRTKLGSGVVEPIIQLSENSYPREIELDLGAGKLYWSAGNVGDDGNGGIFRSNVDGTNVETLLADVSIAGIDLDVAGGQVYFTQFQCESGTGCIRRIDLDGGSLETLVPNVNGDIDAIEVDAVSGKMYYTDEDNGRFYKANLDGTDVELFVNFDFETAGQGLALDIADGKIYWSTRDQSWTGSEWTAAGSLGRSNLDGTDIEIFYHGGVNSGIIIAAPVPEPSSVALISLGLGLLIGVADRRRRRLSVSH